MYVSEVYCVDSRLKEFVAAFELLMFGLYNFDAVNDFKKTCLKSFRLTSEGCQSEGPGAWARRM